MTMIDNIREAARREHAAEQTREQAEATWRAAWWDTTLALAAVQGGDGMAAQAFRAAADELGQSVEWMRARRRTGQRVDLRVLETPKIHTLPPRLTVEYARSRHIDDDAADVLLAAEQDKISIRDLSREQGTQPQSWQRADERTVTAEQVRDAVIQDPAAFRKIAEDEPEVARTIAASPKIRQAVDTSRQESAADRMRAAGVIPAPRDPEYVTDAGFSVAVAALERARQNVLEAQRAIADVAIDNEIRLTLTTQADKVERVLIVLRQQLDGDVDQALVRLIEQEDAG